MGGLYLLLLHSTLHTVGTLCSAAQAPNFCTSLPYTGFTILHKGLSKVSELFSGGSVGKITVCPGVPAAARTADDWVMAVLLMLHDVCTWCWFVQMP